VHTILTWAVNRGEVSVSPSGCWPRYPFQRGLCGPWSRSGFGDSCLVRSPFTFQFCF